MREAWAVWPASETLSRVELGATRVRMVRLVRVALVVGLVVSVVAQRNLDGRDVALRLGVAFLAAAWLWTFYRTTRRHWLALSLVLVALLVGIGIVLHQGQIPVAGQILWCACAVISMERLPLAAAVPAALTSMGVYAAFEHKDLFTTVLITVGLMLAGYVPRLDSEARGVSRRLLVQERAARSAEAETAALEERGRIAREIHDVLAHSLSAQLVHLEAARLLLDRSENLEEDREQLRERVVSARRMAREGLDGTRQALSALRGDVEPLEDHLRRLTDADGVTLVLAGTVRPLPPDAHLTVRRVTQEALTNVRKHAPGALVTVRLTYGEREVELEVSDTGATSVGEAVPAELGGSGSGYGLVGMRERAELLGGTLRCGPGEDGFTVRMRLPA
ncbi:sensor histidine kinase [Streptomyces sp. NPDC059740]|uniref:sensor histidine kinase n=1 Tax=Streptomyces sp. NPDC059740 TaxID=3346926 RepID=UPI00364FEA6B